MEYPKDLNGRPTTKEQWDAYELAVKEHNDFYDRIKPGDKESEEYRSWLQDWSMNHPNKPGYYRANND